MIRANKVLLLVSTVLLFVFAVVYVLHFFSLFFAELYLYVAFLYVGAIGLIFCGFNFILSLRILTSVKEDHAIKPSSAVCLQGVALPIDGALTSPVFKKSCCWYEVTIEAVANQGLLGSSWRLVDQFSSLDLFYIKNDSHRFLVCPFAADISVITEETAQDETINKLNGSYTNELFSHLSSQLGENRLRITERRIEVGQSLFLRGFLYHVNAENALSSLECVNTNLASVINEKKKSFGRSYYWGKWMTCSLRNALIQNTKKSITQFFNSNAIETLARANEKGSVLILGKKNTPYVVSSLPYKKFRNKQKRVLLFYFLGCISSLLVLYAVIFTDTLTEKPHPNSTQSKRVLAKDEA